MNSSGRAHEADQVLHIWETITKRRLNPKHRVQFLEHPALPKILLSLERTGEEHLERIGRDAVAHDTLRLADWASALQAWASRRHQDREIGLELSAKIDDRQRRIAAADPEYDEAPGIPVTSPPSGRFSRRVMDMSGLFPDKPTGSDS